MVLKDLEAIIYTGKNVGFDSDCEVNYWNSRHTKFSDARNYKDASKYLFIILFKL